MHSLLTPTIGAKLEEFTTLDPGFPTLWEKKDLALVLMGVKPATTWIVYSDRRPKALPMVAADKHVLGDAIRFLHHLGLVTEATEPDVVENAEPPAPFRTRVVILIARTAEDLELNRTLWADRSRHRRAEGLGGFPSDDRLYGQLAGFPNSAVAAYVAGDILPIDHVPPDVRQSPAFAFARFALSKDHWQEELDETAVWAKILRQNAPKLYDDIIETFEAMD